MHKTLLYTTLLAFAVYTQIFAAPRLTVVVAVDGLTASNLTLLRPYWRPGGLRTLSEEAYQAEVPFAHTVLGGDETSATLLTGVLPMVHNYAADRYFARADRQVHESLEDPQAAGIGTKAHYSPRAVLSPTITDRLRMRYPQAKIYAVGQRPYTTILLAGHSANACCWVDEQSAQWVTTTYYPLGLPAQADSANVQGQIEQYAAREWTPRLTASSYLRPTSTELKKLFAYSGIKHLLHSPIGNKLVIDLGLRILQDEQLGVDAQPDMLLLQLTSLTPKALSDEIASAEQEDMYLALNQDLGYLLEQLDRRIGKEQYQILVVGLPRLGANKQSMEQAGLAVSEFNIDRASALLNTYLMALYGHERWVDGGYNDAIYLNRTLIEQKRADLAQLQQQAANFLMEFEGVQRVYTQPQVLNNSELLPSFTKRAGGDLYLILQPGWQISSTNGLTYLSTGSVKAPVLYRSGSRRQFPDQRLQATDIIDLLDL